MLSIHLYGDLRKLAEKSKATDDSTLEVAWEKNETTGQLLSRLGIGEDEVGEMFINHKPVNLEKKIPKDARVALFSAQMYLLCGGQHLKGHGFITKRADKKDYWNEDIEIKVKLYATLRKYKEDVSLGESFSLKTSPNSKVIDLINKLDIPKDEVQIVLINGNKKDLETKLSENDLVVLFPKLGGG